MHIKVRVTAGARKEEVVREDECSFRMRIKEPRERNLANARIREILGRELGVPAAKIRLLTGHRSSSKIYTVDM